LKHFPAQLGSTVVIGASPVAAEPSLRASEAAGEAKTTKNAKATVTEVLDTGKGSIMNAGKLIYVRNSPTPLN
jgi:hypothetical protein